MSTTASPSTSSSALGPFVQACRSEALRPALRAGGPEGWGPENPRWYRDNPDRRGGYPTACAASSDAGSGTPASAHGAASASCGRDSVNPNQDDQGQLRQRKRAPSPTVPLTEGAETCGSGHREAVVQHPRWPSCSVSTPMRWRREDSRWRRDSQSHVRFVHVVWHAGRHPQSVMIGSAACTRSFGRASWAVCRQVDWVPSCGGGVAGCTPGQPMPSRPRGAEARAPPWP